MGLRSQQQQSKIDRSRCRERASSVSDGFARSLIGPAHHGEGNGQFKIDSDSVCGSPSTLKQHSIGFEPRRSSSKKSTGTPMKTLHEEMTTEKKVRQSSPSVIARLMGLDTLQPPQAMSKKQKEIGSSFPNKSYEDQKFKDVFEIKETRNVQKHKDQSVSKGTSWPRRDETDVAFIRQKFMEAKRLSTDETLRSSKEFSDAIEVLDSNKDLFIKFLQEPSSLYSNHLHDLNGFPPATQESHIMILQSAKGKKRELGEVSLKSGVNNGRYNQKQNTGITSIQKPTPNLFNRSLKEHSGSLSHRLKSQYAGKTDTSHRSHIVVLKPNLEKDHEMTRKISQQRSHDNYQFGYRRHRELHQSRFQELHTKEKQQPNPSENVDVMSIHSTSTVSDERLISRFNRAIKDKSLCAPPSMCNLKNSGAYQQISDKFDCWNNMSNPSSSSSTESFVCMADKKRQSEKMARGMLHTELYPSGNSNSDGWKDGYSTNLPRSSSLPASPTVHEASRLSSRRRVSDSDNYMLKDALNFGNGDPLHRNSNHRGSFSQRSFKPRSHKPYFKSGGEENKLPVREIHVNKEEWRTGNNISDHSEVKPTVSKLFDNTTGNSSNLVDNSSVTEPMIAEMSFVTNEGHIEQPLQKEESSGNNHTNEAIQEAESGHPQVDSKSLTSSKESEQLSPVSILELPEVEYSPASFERVGADLQELRMQLQFLRLESDTRDKDSEENTEDCKSPLTKGVTPKTFRKHEDRDYSYLLDILIVLGVHSDYFCFLNHPVDLTVFEKLEERYGKLIDWSKSERRLLFDVVSSIIAEIQAQPPWVKLKRSVGLSWGRGGLVESVWQKVDGLRKESSRGKPEEKVVESKWLDLVGDVDEIGREIEEMLKEELLEELASEFYDELV